MLFIIKVDLNSINKIWGIDDKKEWFVIIIVSYVFVKVGIKLFWISFILIICCNFLKLILLIFCDKVCFLFIIFFFKFVYIRLWYFRLYKKIRFNKIKLW